jgi:adenine/guanine/hypoxanthine permease
MGLFVNVPVALAPGMGLNGYFATIAATCHDNPTGDINGVQCPSWGVSTLPWSDAMGAVFLSGWFYLALTLTGLRGLLFQAIPKSLRASITVGIGFFITIIGLKIGSITRTTLNAYFLGAKVYEAGDCANFGGQIFCNKPVDLNFTWYDLGIVQFNLVPAARIAVLGLVFVAGLEVLRVPGSIIISICLATFIGINYVRCNSQADGNSEGCVTDLSNWGPHTTFLANTKDIPSGRLTFKYANK